VKLLVVTPRIPYPPESGGDLRNWALVSRLAGRHEVALLARAVATRVPRELESRCVAVSMVPAEPARLGRRLASLVRGRPDLLTRVRAAGYEAAFVERVRVWSPDVVVCEGLDLTAPIARIRRVSPDVAILYDAHNVEHLLQERARDMAVRAPAQWPLALWSHVQAGRLRVEEQRVCAVVDQVTCTSRADAERLAGLGPAVSPIVVPNGIDTVADRPGRQERDIDVVFTGTFAYRPNRDAVRWLVQDILPRVRQARPATRVTIVGPDPPTWLAAIEPSRGVTVTGRVPDARAVVARARVSVAPLRVGSGTRLKVLEALSLGVPVVSTRLGVEGLDLVDGHEFLAAEDAAAFADAIVRLLNDAEARSRLAMAGRTAASRYTWDRILPHMEEALDAARARASQRIARTW
jgi:glycosyltransferase involved in cell wall biosynthesis